MTQGKGLDICVLGLRAFDSYLCRVFAGKSRGQCRQIWQRALYSVNSAMLSPHHLCPVNYWSSVFLCPYFLMNIQQPENKKASKRDLSVNFVD